MGGEPQHGCARVRVVTPMHTAHQLWTLHGQHGQHGRAGPSFKYVACADTVVGWRLALDTVNLSTAHEFDIVLSSEDRTGSPDLRARYFCSAQLHKPPV